MKVNGSRKHKMILEEQRSLNVFRFIDNLTTLNDNREFERSLKEISPPELVLKKENLTNSERYLDLLIKVKKINFSFNSGIREMIYLPL